MPLRRFLRPLFLLAVLAGFGCAQAPVQEMSDARQAIQAARVAVGDDEAGRGDLATAEELLKQAETALEAGRYGNARDHAAAAKTSALEAHAKAGPEAR